MNMANVKFRHSILDGIVIDANGIVSRNGNRITYDQIKLYMNELQLIHDNKKEIMKRAKIRHWLFKMFGYRPEWKYFIDFTIGNYSQNVKQFDLSTGLCRNAKGDNYTQYMLTKPWFEHKNVEDGDMHYPISGSDGYCAECCNCQMWLNPVRWEYVEFNLKAVRFILNEAVDQLFTTKPLSFI